MFPASFAPYIIKLIAPKLTEKIGNHVAKMFKLPQMLNYMELPNDTDIRVDKLEEQMKVMVDVQIDSKEWEDVKETIKKIKNKKVFKSLNAK